MQILEFVSVSNERYVWASPPAVVFIPTLCSTCGSELQALKLNLYLGICIFFSATFCLVTLQNTDLASDTCNTGTGTGRRRDRTALQSPWKSVPCQFRWMGRKRQRIHGVVESSESAFWSTRGGGSSGPAGCSFPASWRAKQPEIASTALPSLSDHLRIEELRLTSPQGSFFPVAGRPRHPCLFSCGARPIRCSCSYVIAVLLGPVNLATILTWCHEILQATCHDVTNNWRMRQKEMVRSDSISVWSVKWKWFSWQEDANERHWNEEFSARAICSVTESRSYKSSLEGDPTDPIFVGEVSIRHQAMRTELASVLESGQAADARCFLPLPATWTSFFQQYLRWVCSAQVTHLTKRMSMSDVVVTLKKIKKKYYTKSALAAMQEVTDCICCVHACNRKKSSINYLF